MTGQIQTRQIDMRLLILGTGGMANAHAEAFKAIPGVKLVAGVDVRLQAAKAFARKHGFRAVFTDLDEAIAWGGFDAAANVTPDAVHHPTTLKLIAAGKHVFCEKPLAETYEKAREMALAAEQAGIINMVNLTYRNVAQLQKARALIAGGEIGEIRHVEASYRQSWLVANTWGDWRSADQWLWRLSQAHGSRGVLGDVGIHIIDFATFATGLDIASLQARLQTFDKAPGNRIGDYTLDANDSAMLSVAFTNGALGVIHASRYMTGYTNTLRLHAFGTNGVLEIDHSMSHTTLRLCSGDDVHTQAWRDVSCEPVATNYAKFAAAVREGKQDSPDFRHAAELQRAIDLCYDPAAQQAARL
jgi:predicted dehydrogenase